MISAMQDVTPVFSRLLPKLFRGGQAFVGVESALSDLTAELAVQKAENLPHSAAQILAHINWWNRWMLDVIEAGCAIAYPANAAQTWPVVTASDWPRLKNEFYDLLVRIDTHAARPDLASPVNHEETIGEMLADFAMHTAHHFGQLVSVRQAIGAWPPAGGGESW